MSLHVVKIWQPRPSQGMANTVVYARCFVQELNKTARLCKQVTDLPLAPLRHNEGTGRLNGGTCFPWIKYDKVSHIDGSEISRAFRQAEVQWKSSDGPVKWRSPNEVVRKSTLRGGTRWYEVSSAMLRWKEAEPIRFHHLHFVPAEDSTAREQIVMACPSGIWRALPCHCVSCCAIVSSNSILWASSVSLFFFLNWQVPRCQVVRDRGNRQSRSLCLCSPLT